MLIRKYHSNHAQIKNVNLITTIYIKLFRICLHKIIPLVNYNIIMSSNLTTNTINISPQRHQLIFNDDGKPKI